MTWGLFYWPKFLIAGSMFFLLPELFALITNASNTLSDYCWRELNVNVTFGEGQHSVAWWASLASWLVFTIIITLHIWWRSV